MQRWGGNLFFFGVGSIILSFLHMQFILLIWIDLWGSTVGWSIRIGMAVLGGAMWLMGRQQGTTAHGTTARGTTARA